MCAEKSETPRKVDLDNILIEEVGQFGKYQILMLILAFFPIMFSAFGFGEYVFTTARIRHRCLIPECDSSDPEFTPSWIFNAIPSTSSGSFESCERFANITNLPNLQTQDYCPAEAFDVTLRQKCDKFVYEDKRTVVYDFNLGCEEWRRTQIGSYKAVGLFFSMPITGYVSDRWGRRFALVINACNSALVGLARSFVNSYEWFLVLEVLEATIAAGVYSSCYILVTELVGPRYRVLAGALCGSFFALGQMTMGFIAWGIPNWRTFTQILYGPQLLFLSYLWIITESVRWLISKGRYEESEEVLKKMAKMNKKNLSEKSLEAMRATAEAKKNVTKMNEPWLVVLVFRSRNILFRSLVFPIWWVTNTLIYYGMNINAVNLIGNRYLNYVAIASMDIPGKWTTILLLDRVGRKPVLIGGYFICAACQFSFAFMSEENSSLRLAIYLIGKYCIAGMISTIYVYTAELFPTKYRHNFLGFFSMIGRLGSILAPLTPALAQEVWEPFPSVLFGSFAIISGFLVFTTPETLGTKLPETFEDAEMIKNKRAVA